MSLAMIVKLVMKNWHFIAIGLLLVLCAVFFGQWQSAREDVGEYRNAFETEKRTTDGLRKKLVEANKAVSAAADDGAVSYGQCQDLAKTNVTVAFDHGVNFGRATCPKPNPANSPSSVSSAVQDLHSEVAKPNPSPR